MAGLKFLPAPIGDRPFAAMLRPRIDRRQLASICNDTQQPLSCSCCARISPDAPL